VRRASWLCVVVAAPLVLVLPALGSTSPSSKPGAGVNTAATASSLALVTPSKVVAVSDLPSTRRLFAKKYGRFAAVTRTGSSDGLVPIPRAAKAGLVRATYSGSGNFIVESLDARNETNDLLVNTIGAYSGTTVFGFGLSSSRSVRLKVTASGRWTIRVAPIASAPQLKSPASGKSDKVYLWDGKATTWRITNRGSGNFVVQTYGSGLFGDDLLVNEIGAYRGSVPVKAGPAVTTIVSDGTWRITFR
jgi:hypothetical protein